MGRFELPSYSAKRSPTSTRQILDSVLWALRFCRAKVPVITTLLLISGVLRSVSPVGLALVLRSLINVVAGGLQAGGLTSGDLTPLLAAAFAMAILESVGGLFHTYLVDRLSDDLNVTISSDMMTHASRVELAQFENSDFRDTLARAQENIALHFARFVAAGVDLVSASIQTLGLLIILVAVEPVILIVIAVVSPPYLFYMWRVAERRFRTEYSRVTRRRWTQYYMSLLLQNDSAQEIRLLDIADYLIGKFRALMQDFHDVDLGFHNRRFIAGTLFVFGGLGGLYVAFARIAASAMAGAVSLGDLAIFGGALARLTRTAEGIVEAVVGLIERALYVSNLRAFQSVQPAGHTSGHKELQEVRGKLELRDVTFTYPGATAPVLKNINLVVEPGQTMAIVGENGAGKTTLAKLVARIYEPDSGVIFLDGTDLRDLDIRFLHRQMSFVFQTLVRYEASIAENLAYADLPNLLGKPDEIERRAQAAGIDGLVHGLPQGFDTRLGRLFGEVDLSGGQWQRLAIARAFMRPTALLLLDEPTANLDARAEHELFLNFRQLAQSRTTILISHRFSTVSMADQIVVLDQGTIVEQGTHKALLKRGGLYAQLYDLHHKQIAGDAA